MELQSLQREFCTTIVDEDADLSGWLQGVAPDRLAIYRNAYRARMLECLGNVFAITKAWVGDEAFVAAAQDHIVRIPPYSRSLDDYGVAFDDTLYRLFQEDPEVAELAWIEWTMHRIFCVADETILSFSTLPPALLDPGAWDGATIHFASNLTARKITTNAAAIWQAIENEATVPDTMMLDDPSYICVWRSEFAPMYRTINASEYAAMVAIRNDATFGELCAMLAADTDENVGAAMAGQYLAQWLGDGLIVEINT